MQTTHKEHQTLIIGGGHQHTSQKAGDSNHSWVKAIISWANIIFGHKPVAKKWKKNYFYLVNETRRLSYRKDDRVMCSV